MSPAAAASPVWVLDRARIEVALEGRLRYRYVHPTVAPAPQGAGWVVRSPNCSRRIDPAGGPIDIAWLQPLDGGAWRLHGRDHDRQAWVARLDAPHLPAALERLVLDPLKEFWP